jgi:hypothetical protein
MIPAITVIRKIADFPELPLEMPDITVETSGQIGQMLLLTFFAGHPVGLAVDANGDLRHSNVLFPG